MYTGQVNIYRGDYCYDSGVTGEHADPGTTITVSCSVENGPGVDAFQWLLNENVEESVTNGQPASQAFGENDQFMSTVIYYNESIRTNVTLSFTAVPSLDNTVIGCDNGAGSSDSCTLKIKSQLYII